MINTKISNLEGINYVNNIPQTDKNENGLIKPMVDFVKQFKIISALK